MANTPGLGYVVALITTASAAMTAIFSVLIWRVYRGQWETMNEQAAYMREGLTLTKQSADTASENVELAKVQLRPYLQVKSCRLIEEAILPQWPRIELELVNHGGTPAGITFIETTYDIPEFVSPTSSTRKSVDGATMAEVFPGVDPIPLTIRLRRNEIPVSSFYLQAHGRIAYLNRVDKKTEVLDFGYAISRDPEGHIAYQRADGMRNTIKWAYAAQEDPGVRDLPEFLVGDPDQALAEYRRRKK